MSSKGSLWSLWDSKGRWGGAVDARSAGLFERKKKLLRKRGLSAGLKWTRWHGSRKRLVAAGCRREGLVGRADYNLSGEQWGGGCLLGYVADGGMEEDAGVE